MGIRFKRKIGDKIINVIKRTKITSPALFKPLPSQRF